MFNFDPTTLFLSILFSIIGIGYVSYGRKHNSYFLLSGIALLVFPYFVNQYRSLLLLGIILIVLPFILQRLDPL